MTTMTAPPDINLGRLSASVEAALAAAPPVTVQPAAPPPADARPKFDMPRLEAAPTLREAIESVIDKHLRGKGKAQDEKRAALVQALADELAELPIYGVEVDYARVAIGEPIDLGNATVEVDGYGAASVFLCEGGTPIWDPQ